MAGGEHRAVEHPPPLDHDWLASLPEELLLNVFDQLARVGPCWDSDNESNGPSTSGRPDQWLQSKIPFRSEVGADTTPHPGMRAYPFLGQVCKRWKSLLGTHEAKGLMWRQLVIDFGHELVTAIHTPLKWSNTRPSNDEFTLAFQGTTLSANKVLDFVNDRARNIQSLVLCNSEGFWGEHNVEEYLSLSNKHNFQASHLGFMLGTLRSTLKELRLFYCNDLLTPDTGVWSMAAQCSNLESLSVEGVNHRLASSTLVELSKLKKLHTLSIAAEEHSGTWIIGLDAVPQAWSQLQSLTTLELRGHQILDGIPPWLKDMPKLRKLDVSSCSAINIASLPDITQLETLVLQRLDLSQMATAGEQVSQLAKKYLPDLTPLKGLRALSLSGNRMTRLPDFISKLTSLEVLDVSGNMELQVMAPLTTVLAALPRVCVMDFRGVHKEKNKNYWSDTKCTTMKHLADCTRLLKRRKYQFRVLLDSE